MCYFPKNRKTHETKSNQALNLQHKANYLLLVSSGTSHLGILLRSTYLPTKTNTIASFLQHPLHLLYKLEAYIKRPQRTKLQFATLFKRWRCTDHQRIGAVPGTLAPHLGCNQHYLWYTRLVSVCVSVELSKCSIL